MTQLTSIFMRVIDGMADDASALREHWMRWPTDLAPDADGWLGSSAGVSEEGRFFGTLRFAAAESARRLDQRDDYQSWFDGLRELIGGGNVENCHKVATIARGSSTDATSFVVVRGRSTDLESIVYRVAETEEEVRSPHPLLIGGHLAAHEDDEAFTETLYFRTDDPEEDLRKVEEEVSIIQDMSAYVADLERVALLDPWIHAA